MKRLALEVERKSFGMMGWGIVFIRHFDKSYWNNSKKSLYK